jgi:hypothetical protein
MTGDQFKTFEAALDNLSLEGKKATATDKDGIIYSMLWKSPYIDEKMRKMQEGYYRQFTCEVQGDYLLLTNLKYLESPDWVKAKYAKKSGFGGGGGKPRNEKLIVYQTVYKECCETVRALVLLPDSNLDEAEYNRLMDIAMTRTKKDAQALIEAAGEVK